MEAKQLANKAKQVVSKGFTEVGPVKSCINLFLITKGDSDIMVVYDAPKWSLINAPWDSNCYIITTGPIIRKMDHSSWYCNEAIAEEFMNSILGNNVMTYKGIDAIGVFR